MSIGGYKIRNQKEIHFLSFAVVDWADVFTRQLYRDIVVRSLVFCQENKQENRKAWLLEIFKKAGEGNLRNHHYQFWRQDNQPKEIFSRQFTINKLGYIHNNPVEAGLVDKPHEYIYSSARDYYHTKRVGLLKIDFI